MVSSMAHSSFVTSVAQTSNALPPESTFTSPAEMVVPATLGPLTMPPDDTISTLLLATSHRW